MLHLDFSAVIGSITLLVNIASCVTMILNIREIVVLKNLNRHALEAKQAVVGFEEAVCSKCKRRVARYETKENGKIECKNCLNGNL